MNFKPHDQLAANIADAQRRWNCTLHFPTVEALIEEIERRYNPQEEDFETTLENALWWKDIEESVEWECYKMALGLFFGNRGLQKLKKAG